MSNNSKGYTINDVINELKRLQVEHGDIPVVRFEEYSTNDKLEAAWPVYNESKKRIEF